MTTTPPQLARCLIFLTGRLAKAGRDAQMRPSKARQQRLRSLELLAAACVSEAARIADQGRPAPPPRLEPEMPVATAPETAPPPPSEEMTEPGVRGVWTPPPG
jgi:hypothetical protein